VPSAADAEGCPPTADVVTAPAGLPTQRNVGLDALRDDIGVVIFIDDDVMLRPDFCAEALALFAREDAIVAFSGSPVLDGAISGEVRRNVAERALRAADKESWWTPAKHLYGCNMIVRAAVAKQVRFDERLRGYAFLEDRDFGARCAQFGRVGYYGGCRLVHLGVNQGGRSSARRYGFSQVMNPVYLAAKGTVTRPAAARLVARWFAANIAGVVLRDDAVDRRARLRGNSQAARFLVRGHVAPEAVEEISSDPPPSQNIAGERSLLGRLRPHRTWSPPR
jgi:hypothetical protein